MLMSDSDITLTQLHSEQSKLHKVLAILNAKGLNKHTTGQGSMFCAWLFSCSVAMSQTVSKTKGYLVHAQNHRFQYSFIFREE